jgi:hypothetical protein
MSMGMNRGMPVFARRFREWEIKTPALSHKPRQGQGTRIGIKPAKGWASPQSKAAGNSLLHKTLPAAH